jgi:hypothetical protein
VCPGVAGAVDVVAGRVVGRYVVSAGLVATVSAGFCGHIVFDISNQA